MGWLNRLVGGESPAPEASPEPVESEAEERPSLGVSALFNGVRTDREHAVLDLGRASESSLAVYGRYARRIRFADVLREDRQPTDPKSGQKSQPQTWTAALNASVPPQPECPYDLILAWDVLDRLAPEARDPLVQLLADRSSNGARLHVIVDASDRGLIRPMHFSILDVDRIRHEPSGPEVPARPRLLPAEVERLLSPFEVVRAFTSRSGMREYMAIRR